MTVVVAKSATGAEIEELLLEEKEISRSQLLEVFTVIRNYFK